MSAPPGPAALFIEAHKETHMTPERLTGLAAMLLELRDWIAETDPGALDYWLVDAVVDSIGRRRAALVAEGAK